MIGVLYLIYKLGEIPMFTHNSYREAVSFLESNRNFNGTVRWDAGEGWTAEAYWHRGRMMMVSINPDGMRIV
jgi:hypothetical protein